MGASAEDRGPAMRRGAPLLGALLLAACAGGPVCRDATFRTIDDRPVQPLLPAPDRLHALVFVSHDCPIANSYAPEIGDLARDLAADGVTVFVVHVDPEITAEQARAHQRDYRLPDPVLLDPRHRLAAAVGATVTPEVALLDAGGVRYLGRIDDQWSGLGSRRQTPGRRDLREAVAELRAGASVSVPRTPAIGCLLPEPAR